jgi:FAD:protein FMN transferase
LLFARPIVIIVLLSLLTVIFVQRCPEEKTGVVSRSRIVMGTVVEITAFGDDSDFLTTVVTDAFNEMARIENLMSFNRKDSDVARLSRPDTVVDVSPETAKVISLGLMVGKASKGAFDMTLGRLKTLWGIDGSEHPRIPAPEEIQLALASAGQNTLKVEGNRIIKGFPDLAVDLGGVAKGYAVDRAIEVLQQAGVENASVNAGGDIRLLGDCQGRPWRIGIQHPRRKDGLLATLAVQNTAVVTSGDYERFFEKDGVRYHHLFDSQTGYPASLSQSVTVVADSAAMADALATAAFVLGPDLGLDLLEEFPEVEGILVAPDGTSKITDGLKGRVNWP